jgi:hypothetical protein
MTDRREQSQPPRPAVADYTMGQSPVQRPPMQPPHWARPPVQSPGFGAPGHALSDQLAGVAPRRRRRWPWILAIVAIVLCGVGSAIAIAISGGVKAVQQVEQSQMTDVTITGCSVDSMGIVSAPYTITNSGTIEQDYLLDVQVKQAGTIVGSASAIATNVPPGGKATGKATGIVDVAARTGITCSLVGA